MDGSTSAQAYARYTLGNSGYGVTVPSAHSLSPSITGSITRHIFFLDLTPAYNDANTGVSAVTSISNLTTLVNSARADGWFVVLITSPVVYSGGPATLSPAQTIIVQTVNQAARNHSIPSDLVVDSARWLSNQGDTNYYSDVTGGPVTSKCKWSCGHSR